MTKSTKKSFSTLAVHAGERQSHSDYTPVVTPIHSTVGFLYKSMKDVDDIFDSSREGYVYPRYGSPTIEAFEKAMVELEGGEISHAFSTGMAAIHAALLSVGVQEGKTVLSAMDVYGSTYTLLKDFFYQMGVSSHFVDITDLKQVERALSEFHPIVLLAETISNPLLKVTNIPELSKLSHQYKAKLLIDNTFASPFLYQPLLHGADFVIHSATKYIGGHGDVMAGVVITSSMYDHKLSELKKLIGGILGPFDAWLAMRGLKTLPLRMQKQCQNAAHIAQWLSRHPKIKAVNYPGLNPHPQHNLAQEMFEGRGFGGMLSFEIAGVNKATSFRFMEALNLCLPATTLGDIYTLVLHPASSSHRTLTPEEKKQIGISEGLIRLSSGIEDVSDIILDLEQAFSKI
ncbi:trans-sulfuration enzyme family protein [Acidobacteriota bacterium]